MSSRTAVPAIQPLGGISSSPLRTASNNRSSALTSIPSARTSTFTISGYVVLLPDRMIQRGFLGRPPKVDVDCPHCGQQLSDVMKVLDVDGQLYRADTCAGAL